MFDQGSKSTQMMLETTEQRVKNAGGPQCRCVPAKSLQSCLFATLWTVACQPPLSIGFSRQEYWSGLPCPPPGDLPNPGIKPASLASPVLAGRFFITSATWEAPGPAHTYPKMRPEYPSKIPMC